MLLPIFPYSHDCVCLGNLLFLFGKQIVFLITESKTHSIVVYGGYCVEGYHYSAHCMVW